MDRVRSRAEKAQEKRVSDRLEPLKWRTTQREQGSGYEHRATAGKWGGVLDYIIGYQNKHHTSPPDHVIARDTKLTIGQVKYHIAEMEKRGLLKDHKGFPRHIQILNGGSVASATEASPQGVEEKTEEVRVRTRTKAPTKRFIDRAKEAAVAIKEFHAKYGMPPGISDISAAVYGTQKSSGATRLIQLMVEQGWATHQPGHQYDIKLTGAGQAVLLDEQPDRPQRETRREPAPQPLSFFAPPEPVVELRRAAPQPTPVMPAPPPQSLEEVDTLDLVLEMQRRGFKVSR